MEKAAKGELKRGDEYVTMEELAQELKDQIPELAEKAGDYAQSQAYWKMAPVLAVITVASAGAGAAVSALGAGTGVTVGASAMAATGANYALNALDANTSVTGSTIESRETKQISLHDSNIIYIYCYKKTNSIMD